MSDSVPWFGGLACDHLYANCPNRVRVLNGPRRVEREWCEMQGVGLDPYGTDVCGLCLHRYKRTKRGAA